MVVPPPLLGNGTSYTLLVDGRLGVVEPFMVKKIEIVAKICGINLILDKCETNLCNALKTCRGLVLKVSHPPHVKTHSIYQSNSILRFLATVTEGGKGFCLMGSNEVERGQVDSWLEACWNEIEVPLAMSKLASAEAGIEGEAQEHIKFALMTLNKHLSTRTYLVGHRLTIADVSICCVIETLASKKTVYTLNPTLWGSSAWVEDLLSGLTDLIRWYRTVTLSHEFRIGQRLDKGEVNDNLSAADYKKDTPGTTIDVGFPLQSAVVKRIEDPVNDIFKTKFNRRRIRVNEVFELGESGVGSDVVIRGWIRTMRSAQKGKLLFLAINDGSCQASLQVVANAKDTIGFDETSQCGGVGACIAVCGKVVASPGKGQALELQALRSDVLGSVDAESYPMAKKQHTLEFLRTQAHLRPRTRVCSAVTRIRHAMAIATHRFFDERGFYWVNTPIITSADCEGAGEQFVVTNLLPEENQKHKIPILQTGTIDYANDFFGQRACLAVSGQLNVETHTCAMGDCYTFGPTFRAEASHTSRHLAEFWMVEPEIAFADLKDSVDLAEDYIKYLVAYGLTHCRSDLEFLQSDGLPPGAGEKGLIKRLQNVLENDFARITYTEAIELLENHVKEGKVKFEESVSWGIDMGSEHERYLSENVYKKPVVVTNYPKEFKAFYMRLDEGGRTVAAMDVLVPKIGELVGGAQREERAEVLQARIAEMGLSEKSMWWFCDIRRYGTMKHAGFGLGFERLLQFMTGIDNIRDVIPFPRSTNQCNF